MTPQNEQHQVKIDNLKVFKTEDFCVLQTGVRGESAHSGQEAEVLPASKHVVLRQITAQRSSHAVAEQHQGHQQREHEIHGEDEAAAGLAETASGGILEVGCLMIIFLSKAFKQGRRFSLS